MKNIINLEDKTFLVTGASSGIGKAISILLDQLGARVVVTGRNLDALNDTLSEMDGSNHKSFICDFNDGSSSDELVNFIAEEVGNLNGFIHCAGIRTTESIRFVNEESMDSVWKLNISSSILLTKALRRKKMLSRGSSVIFMSSILGVIGSPGVAVYSASKGAVISLTKSLAAELALDGIRVNCAIPAMVKTPMFEKMFSQMTEEQAGVLEKKHLLGFGEPEDVANLVVFLLSEASRWITGSCVVIDGGYSLDR